MCKYIIGIVPPLGLLQYGNLQHACASPVMALARGCPISHAPMSFCPCKAAFENCHQPFYSCCGCHKGEACRCAWPQRDSGHPWGPTGSVPPALWLSLMPCPGFLVSVFILEPTTLVLSGGWIIPAHLSSNEILWVIVLSFHRRPSEVPRGRGGGSAGASNHQRGLGCWVMPSPVLEEKSVPWALLCVQSSSQRLSRRGPVLWCGPGSCFQGALAGRKGSGKWTASSAGCQPTSAKTPMVLP